MGTTLVDGVADPFNFAGRSVAACRAGRRKPPALAHRSPLSRRQWEAVTDRAKLAALGIASNPFARAAADQSPPLRP